jgi:hypothetical protein
MAPGTYDRLTPFHMVVTNVPGPQQPLYMLGAKLEESYPLVPITGDLGLGIALFSHCGQIFWGFSADWELLPDLHDFVEHVESSFVELLETAGGKARPRRSPAKAVMACSPSVSGARRTAMHLEPGAAELVGMVRPCSLSEQRPETSAAPGNGPGAASDASGAESVERAALQSRSLGAGLPGRCANARSARGPRSAPRS